MSSEHQLTDLLPLLKLNEYISFDLETTGLNPKFDRITEISACRFVNGQFSEEFTSLINPEIPIPKNIIALTGITNKMVKDAPIILLDEATSSLDADSEEKVQNAIMNLTKNKTTLVIAHRLSTIIKANKIIVVNHGKIVDIGTHNDLLKNSSIYKNLYSKQLSTH